jgi:hypothetical protein
MNFGFISVIKKQHIICLTGRVPDNSIPKSKAGEIKWQEYFVGIFQS